MKRISFNAFGDKFAALNTGGELFLMNFDLETSSKVDPIFHTPSDAGRFVDFSFLDRDCLVAALSARDKNISIFDTAMPPR